MSETINFGARIPDVKIDDMEARRTFDGDLSLGRLAPSGSWILSMESPERVAVELILTAQQAADLAKLLVQP